MKISILGTGIFSLAMAINMANNKDNKIMMWSEDKNLVKEFSEKHTLSKIKLNCDIPSNIEVSNNYQDVLNNTDIIFIIPAIKYLKGLLLEAKPYIKKNIPLVLGTKGIYEGKYAIEIVNDILKNPSYLMLGATYAEDVMNNNLIGFSIGYKSKKGINIVKKALDLDNIILDFKQDYLGLSVCSVLKNIYAIGSGILNGLGYKTSTNALYLKEVFKELARVLKKCKASDVLISDAGFADLIATCSANDSRNFNFGKLLGSKALKKDINAFIKKNTIEGYSSLEEMNEFLKKKNIRTPIFDSIYGIVLKNQTIKTLIIAIKNN